MRYPNITRAAFIDRPNRFIARADTGAGIETVHVKNTGRLGELLVPGAEVYLTAPDSTKRKTKYDLVAVRGGDGRLFNIDSQAPNAVVGEWLRSQSFDSVEGEYRYGSSRIDFYMTRRKERFLMEVKGCTLVIDGVGRFPDAPTVRGVKHIYELISAKKEGCRAILAFVIQTEGVYAVEPNRDTHPEFADALEKARREGVEIMCLPCRVDADGMDIAEGIIIP